jgi:hypothetical protein
MRDAKTYSPEPVYHNHCRSYHVQRAVVPVHLQSCIDDLSVCWEGKDLVKRQDEDGEKYTRTGDQFHDGAALATVDQAETKLTSRYILPTQPDLALCERFCLRRFVLHLAILGPFILHH